MTDPLIRELHIHSYLRERLVEEFPDADEETLMDTLEGLTNLHEKLAAVVRSQQEDRVLSDALKTRVGEMQERQRRLEHRVTKKRELVASVMDRASISKITESDFTISLRQTPRSLQIIDESFLPADYWKVQPPKLDRKRLLDDLKSGVSVHGAELGNGGVTVSVRVS